MSHFLGYLHNVLSRNLTSVRLCIALRNQVNAIIGRYLGESPNSEKNGEMLLARHLAPLCQTFVDVGANRGDWSAIWLQHAPPEAHGLLFEPSLRTFAHLEARYANNSQVVLLQKAVSNVAGYADFHYHEAFDEISTLAPVGLRDPKDSLERVEVTTIDIEAKTYSFQDIDFLKIDAEGFDSHVLHGASTLLQAQRIRFLQFEYGQLWADSGSTLTETLHFLKAAGYHTYLLRSDGLHHFDIQKFGEYFRYSNFVAVRAADSSLLAQTVPIRTLFS